MRKTTILLLIGIAFLSCKQNNKNNIHLDKNQIVKDSLTAKLDSIQKNGQLNGYAVAMVN